MRNVLILALIVSAGGWVVAQPQRQAVNAPSRSILIENGTLVDGTGGRRRRADVRIRGDQVLEVGSLTARGGERVVDARGKVVAPGFIDTHSHADRGFPEKMDTGSDVRQGITTAVVGQDGGSNLPLAGFFERLAAAPAALNFASFVGHGAVRRLVMGDDWKRAATADEIAEMGALVEQEMRAGALGLSSGLEYDPGHYSTTEELIACAKVAARHGGLYISHVRDEGNGAFDSIRELIRIAGAGRLPAQISHIKLGTMPVWGRAAEAVQLIESANRRGLDVSADVYPYRYWSSGITALVTSRDRENLAVWEKGLADVGGAGNVLLVEYTPDPTWAGRTIAAISKMTGETPAATIREIVRQTRGGATGTARVVVTAMDEKDVRRFLRAPRIMFGSDGHPKHPRGAGTYPRILGRYVRQWHVLSLEEAVRKMTSLPARRMGFRDRGVIRPGMKADIVLFDPQRVIDTATPTRPASPPVGISHVFVNGALVMDAGRLTDARPGRVLRRARSATGRTND
jgi:N-acyl-D-amino-acid deacylase